MAEQVGHSYVSIAKENRLNVKTVRDRVKWAEDSNNAQHWTEIGKILDIRHMQEHHQMLLAAARGISRAVSTHPQLVGPGQMAYVLVDHHVLTGLEVLREILAERGIDGRSDELDNRRTDGWVLLEGMAAKLLKGLYQHLPKLEGSVEQWASNWQRFRDELDGLMRETAGALVKSRRYADVSDQLVSDGVQIALQREIGDWVDELLLNPKLEFAVGQAKSRLDPALDALAEIRVSGSACRGLVEDVLLMGGPPGRCRSCPGSDLGS